MQNLVSVILILMLNVCIYTVNAQSAEPQTDTAKIFTFVEVMPEYIEGEGKLMTFINSHIIYPESAKAKSIQGRVSLRFVILENGRVGDIQVNASPDPSLSEEAKRVVKLLAFKPGKQQGKPVKCYYNIPVRFALN